MKFLKACLLAAVLSLGPAAVKAEQVNWASLASYIQANSGTRLSAGTSQQTSNSTLLLVHFNAGTNFSLSYSALLASNSFTTYDTSFVGEGSNPAGQFYASTATNPDGTPASTTLPGAVGDQLYMWFFNSSNPATATQAAIITNVTWVRPASGATSVDYDISDLGTFVPVGAPGSIVNNSSAPGIIQGDVRLSPVPEPSTYALALVGLSVAAGIARRRRQAVS